MAVIVRKHRGTRSLGRRTQRGPRDWRRLAGPPDACRSCGGALEVAGLICGTCKADGHAT